MKFSWLVLAIFFLTAIPPAFAGDDMPDLEWLIRNGDDSAAVAHKTNLAHAVDISDDSLRLTPDETKILRLDQDAASVVVANPEHASVLLDSPRLLIVMPRLPGATTFTVLNARGETIMQRGIIIATAAQPRYVRIRRNCHPDDPACVPTAQYYCPDGCYEVRSVVPTGSAEIPPIAANAGGPTLPPGAIPAGAIPAGTPLQPGAIPTTIPTQQTPVPFAPATAPSFNTEGEAE
ncbi:MAG: pilus assembly protein N-terminal domain-containing protein [Alphaproteobacteria bacterium]|nr:pilus assembly protein N-terminal domain-containing protein [Alphaproteobacteria bacterium]